MIRILVITLICLSFAAAIAGSADEPQRYTPMIKTVEPAIAKVGDELTATGIHLDKSAVARLYIIEGEKTIEVKIGTQSGETITFKVPANVKAGRYQLMVLTTAPPQFLEEPVYFTVE